MPVYVDDMRARFGRMIMCHMVADTTEELDAMAQRIGVRLKWRQYSGEPKEHFDISLAMRAKAVSFGAREITWRQTGVICAHRLAARYNKDKPPVLIEDILKSGHMSFAQAAQASLGL